ncbi:hypothetical protein GCM10012275_59610 [Longimycelium tulufanense]|uniref:Uncharacterized protein n=1 Tax=Longimycelium tulufanense TaxID=907463 RepID=A0A8J3CKI0_9PSEU|nr:hypothetical protein GCM10012275_59610 [Longimycelium tulufanense]
MCPHDTHITPNPPSSGKDDQADTAIEWSRPVDSAGVTVPTAPPQPRNTNTAPKRTRQRRNSRRTGHNLVVRGVRRDPPDRHKLARVVASLAADLLKDETSERASITDTDTADTAAAERKTRRRAA